MGITNFRLPLDGKFNLPPDVNMFLGAYSVYMADICVLIVDDVERVRQDLRTFLTLTGDIEIVGEASNGWEAIHLAEALHPQVILMDLEMPIMDGYDATRRIKANDPSCRVIALTIHAGTDQRRRAFQAGADDFIVKGAPLATLMAAIHDAPALGQMPKGEKT